MDPYAFVQLKAHERVVAVVREHAATHLGGWILVSLLLLLPFFLAFPLFKQGTPGVIALAALLLVGLVALWARWRRYMGTVLIVTDRRVIDVEHPGLFGRRVTDVPYRRVDEVAYERRGISATVFRYATLRVVTSGEGADIEFARAPGAERLRDLIESLRDRAEEARDSSDETR